MKKLIIAAVALAISASASFAQSTTISTNPKLSSEDTTKQNPSANKSTTGPRSANDGGEQKVQGKTESASQAGRATNAGSRTTGNNKSQVSTGGTAGQSSKGATKQSEQPASSRTGAPQSGAKKDN